MSAKKNNLHEEFAKIREQVQRPNILLAGGTGVGKSALLNHVFGENFAKSGTGKPLTQTIDKYSNKDSKVVIFDSKGYEIGGQQEKDFFDDVIGYIEKNENPAEKIHVVWYLISASGSRVTDFDIDAIKRIQKTKTPVSVVFTKSDLIDEADAAALKKVVSGNLPGVLCFEVSVVDDLPESAKDYLESQLGELVDWTVEELPEALKLAFVAAQSRDLEKKRQEARKYVYQHAAGSVPVAFTPIPGSDAPILLANQYALLARVLYVFGLDEDKDAYSGLIKTAITQLLPTIGKWGVAQLVKLIPGIGTLVGGLINAGVAASLTLAFGYAIVETAYYARSKRLEDFSGDKGAFEESISAVFNEALAEAMNQELNKKGK